MRLTDEQVAWNKKAAEYNALRIELCKTLERAKILEKKSPRAARIMRETAIQITTLAIEVTEELSKMKGPDDETEEKGSVQGTAAAR